ncbi:hypothetical protein [Polynucleobacter necessarius]|uniref:hypothetical protein n=1 Tax=Polynucleobacter necessarius TaxID=576610 RepID=UPI0018D5178B|nr:hypothetical protein [Polynucleobacter necessarius]
MRTSLKYWLMMIAGLTTSITMQTTMAQNNSLKPEATYGQGNKSFKLATGSPGELGLLQALGGL